MLASVAVLAVAAAALPAGADMPRRGAVVFADGFDDVGTFAENWGEQGSHVRSESGRMLADALSGVAEASPRRAIPLDAIVEGEISILEDGPVPGWAGFSLDGYLFLVRPDGKSWLNLDGRLEAGDNGKLVALPGFKTGVGVRLTVVRRKVGRAFEYSFFADGEPAGCFAAPVPQQGGAPVFRAFAVKAALDDFAVFAIADGAASPNLITNAGVEHDRDGIPSMFARRGMIDFDVAPLDRYESEYLAGFGVDAAEAHSGRQSLFLKATPWQGGGVEPFNAGTVKGAAGVFSVYLKASVTGATVRLTYAGKSADVHPTTDWARYEVANPCLEGKGLYSPASVDIVREASPDGYFTIWMDDFQAEIVELPEGGFREGVSYAGEFRIADADAIRYGPREEIRRPRFDVPELPAGVVAGIDLDAWRDFAAVGGAFMAGAREATLPTRIQLACDKAHLYVGMRCMGEPEGDLTAPPLLAKGAEGGDVRDVLGIFGKNSIEVLLSPDQKPQWFHLIARANGQQTDLWHEDIGWDGRWRVETRSIPGGIDYFVSIPSADFASPGLDDTWFANFCRNDEANGENSCVYPVQTGEVDFRDIRRWAELRFPHGVAEAWRNAAASADAHADGVDGGARVVGRLNYYMDEPEARFRIVRDGRTEEFAIDIREFPAGTNLVTVGGERAEVVKREYDPNGVQVNRFALCLERHGRKLLPFAGMTPSLHWPWMSPGHIAQVARLWGESGFGYLTYGTQVENFGHMAEAADAVRKVCGEYGMMRFHYIGFLDPTDPGLSREEADGRLERNATARAILDDASAIATIVVDEPELTMKSEDCRRFLNSMRPIYKTRPMVMNNTMMGIPNDYAGLETDILMLDDYLTIDEGRTVEDMMSSIDAMVEKGRETAKPSFAFLVSMNYTLHPCEPTYSQQVAQCYGALASGVNGFVLWGLSPPRTPGNWRAVKQLAREFNVLEGRILAETPPPPVECSADWGRLRFRAAEKDGVLTIVACNIDAQPVGKVVFSLPPPFAAAVGADVLFEGREVKISGGALADDFAGHERHVYSIGVHASKEGGDGK